MHVFGVVFLQGNGPAQSREPGRNKREEKKKSFLSKNLLKEILELFVILIVVGSSGNFKNNSVVWKSSEFWQKKITRREKQNGKRLVEGNIKTGRGRGSSGKNHPKPKLYKCSECSNQFHGIRVQSSSLVFGTVWKIDAQISDKEHKRVE